MYQFSTQISINSVYDFLILSLSDGTCLSSKMREMIKLSFMFFIHIKNIIRGFVSIFIKKPCISLRNFIVPKVSFITFERQNLIKKTKIQRKFCKSINLHEYAEYHRIFLQNLITI